MEKKEYGDIDKELQEAQKLEMDSTFEETASSLGGIVLTIICC